MRSAASWAAGSPAGDVLAIVADPAGATAH